MSLTRLARAGVSFGVVTMMSFATALSASAAPTAPDTPAASPATPSPTPSTTSKPADAVSAHPAARRAVRAAAQAAADPGETPVTSVSLAPLSHTTQPSGSVWSYRLKYSCTLNSGNVCGTGGIITIPLGAAAGFQLTLATNPVVKSYSVDNDGNLVILLNDLGNESGQIGINLVAPNVTTANDTSWTLSPTMSFPDGSAPTATAPTPVTSTATAEPSFDQLNKRADSTFYRDGQTVTYTLSGGCANAPTDVAQTRSLVLTDTLPAGLTYASSTGALSTSVTGQTVTLNIDPANCAGQRAGASFSVQLKATVDAHAPNGALVNTVKGVETTVDGQTATRNASTSITIYDDPKAAGGHIEKYGSGNLRNDEGDEQSQISGSTMYASGTEPGAGYQSSYTVGVVAPASGMTSTVTDPLPCMSNKVGTAYNSLASGVCTAPAWNLKTIYAYGADHQIDLSVHHPVLTLTNGSSVTMTGNTVPSQYVGKVAAISFPRSADITGNVTYTLNGYVTNGVQNGDVVANTASGTIYPDATSTNGSTSSDTGHLYILEKTQLGIVKTASTNTVPAPGTFQWALEGMIDTGSPLTADVVMEDTLPAGISVPRASDVTSQTKPVYSYIQFTNGAPSVQYFPNVTTFANPDGTTKAVFTYPAAEINKYLSEDGGNLQLYLNWTSTNVPAGTYHNTGAIFLDQPGVDTSTCTYGDVARSDPDNLDNNDNTAFHCTSGTTVKVAPTAGSNGMALTKAVKGSQDADFRTYPAAGAVPDTGGNATFRLTWTNRSAGALNKVVLYDVLPHVGDTGVVQGMAKRKRGSQFTPQLSSVPTAPAGFTVYYSAATNPCRPEVFPNDKNPGCTDDWTSTPPGDLASVTALKLVEDADNSVDSLGTVVFDYDLTTPAIDSNKVAWNTFAAAASDAADGDPVTPAESNRVGISRKDYSHITFAKSIASITDPQGNSVDPANAAAGDTVNYDVSATNDGAIDATGVVLTDTLPAGMTLTSPAGNGSTVTINAGTLAPGQVYTASVTATINADVSNTTLTNRLGATATSRTVVEPSPDSECSDDDTRACASITVPPAALLTLHKKVDRATANPGDTLTYTFSVDNSGTADGTITEIYDLLPANASYVSSDPAGSAGGSSVDIPMPSPVKVPAGAKNQVLGTLTVKVNPDAYDATVTNGAVAFSPSGFVPGDATCPDGYAASTIGADSYQVYTSCAITHTNKATSAIALVKTASAPANGVGYTVGEKVTYTFTATNTGNTALTQVALSEGSFTNGAGASDHLDAAPTQATPAGWDGSLTPGATATWTAPYTVSAADVAAGGRLTNTASVQGLPPAGSDGTQPPAVTDSATATAAVAHPAISLVKTATGPSANKVGGVVGYQFTVTNTGNVPLTGLALTENSFTDAQGHALTLDAAPRVASPAGFNPATGVLAPGGVVVYTAKHTLTQADLDVAGRLTNRATVQAMPTDGEAPVSSSSTASATITPHGPAISLVKTASRPAKGTSFTAGQTVSYTFTATNTGDVTLKNVALAEGRFRNAAGKDLRLTSGPTPARGWTPTLAPGRTDVWTATYTVTMPDVATSGAITNQASVTALSGSGSRVSSNAMVTVSTARDCGTCHAPTKAITFQVQVDDWHLRTRQQVATAARVVKDGRYPYREDVVWNSRTGRVLSAPLWPVSTSKVVSMRITVPASATPAQVLALEKAAAAKAHHVTVGSHPAPRAGHTYHSVWVIPTGGWTNTTPWRAGMKSLPQLEVGATA